MSVSSAPRVISPRVEVFATERDFTLPFGYQDSTGTLHREGTMRLATALDEIVPHKDPRVQQNPAYLVIILLSRVITRLGDVSQVTPKVIEGLYAADLAHLQALYNDLNRLDEGAAVRCPSCEHEFRAEWSAHAGG
ncbi:MULTISPECIES: phage tail assembly protein [unclassified Sorangium]|uniref:phage tail assembly protein n=1 Tax=unclassified Sorangium TaxID=2621164 RepID=UPI003F606B21